MRAPEEAEAADPSTGVPRALVFDGHCHVCSGWAQFLARNRHRWFGRRSTCYLPP